jgi:hypothetical protein
VRPARVAPRAVARLEGAAGTLLDAHVGDLRLPRDLRELPAQRFGLDVPDCDREQRHVRGRHRFDGAMEALVLLGHGEGHLHSGGKQRARDRHEDRAAHQRARERAEWGTRPVSAGRFHQRRNWPKSKSYFASFGFAALL